MIMTSKTPGQAPSWPLTLTVEEVMSQLRISRSMAYKLMRSGDLTYRQVGGHRRIHTSSLFAYVADPAEPEFVPMAREASE